MVALAAADWVRWRRIVSGAYQYTVGIDVLDSAGNVVHTRARVPVSSLEWSQAVDGKVSGRMVLPAVDRTLAQPLDWRPGGWSSPLLPAGNRLRVTMTVDSGTEKQSCVLGVALIVDASVDRAASEVTVILGDVTQEIAQQQLEYARPTSSEVGHSHLGWAERLIRSIATTTGYGGIPDPGGVVSRTATVPTTKTYSPGTSYLDVILEALRMTHPDNVLRTRRDGTVAAARLPLPGPDRGYVLTVSDKDGGTLVDVVGRVSRMGAVNRVTVRVTDSRVEPYPSGTPRSAPTPQVAPSSTRLATMTAGILAESAEGRFYRWFRARGLSPAGAAAVCGNIQQESNYDPSAVEPPPGTGIGICQWSASRAQDLRTWQAAAGRAWDDLGGQLLFIEHECAVGYPGLWDRLKTATDARAAAKDFDDTYERSGVKGNRFDYAEQIAAKAAAGQYDSGEVDAWTKVRYRWLANAMNVIRTSHGEVGKGEYGNGQVFYANDYFKAYYGTSVTEWCGIYQAWLLDSCGIPVPEEWKAQARAQGVEPVWPRMLQYIPTAMKILEPFKLAEPIAGALGLLWPGHMVMCVDTSNAVQGWVATIGGNESEKVQLSRYPWRNVNWVCPNYALGPLDWDWTANAPTAPGDPPVTPAPPTAPPPDPDDPKYLDTSSLHTVVIDGGPLSGWHGSPLGQATVVVEQSEPDPDPGAAKARAKELFDRRAGLPRTLDVRCLPLPFLDAGIDPIRVSYGGKNETVEIESWSLTLAGDSYPLMHIVARGWPARTAADLPGMVA